MMHPTHVGWRLPGTEGRAVLRAPGGGDTEKTGRSCRGKINGEMCRMGHREKSRRRIMSATCRDRLGRVLVGSEVRGHGP